MTLKANIKLSTKQWETFSNLFQALLSGGFNDLSIEDAQTCVRLWLDDERGWCLRLHANGTWDLE